MLETVKKSLDTANTVTTELAIDADDRRIILATQAGLPLTIRPYHAIADDLDMNADELMRRFRRLLDNGVIRRIGVIPNHYAIGYRANGMSVWDVNDDHVHALGEQVGQLDFVSHCYLRPRHQPLWPYNFFAMVHGRQRDEVEQYLAIITDILGKHCRQHEVLYSKRILKKTGLRLGQ